MKIVSSKKVMVGTGEVQPDFPNKFFDQILAFLGYGFCKCLSLDSMIQRNDGEVELGEIKEGDEILSKMEDGSDGFVKVLHVFESERELWEMELENGYSLKSSLDHKYLCVDGEMHTLREIWFDHPLEVVIDGGRQSQLISCRKIGVKKVRDLEVDHPLHRFYANGIVVSNSHALSYSMYSAVELWLKAYYPLEFMCANLSITDRATEKKGVPLLDQRVKYSQSLGFRIYPPYVNEAVDKWKIHDGGLMAPLTNLKGFGVNDYEKVLAGRPYSSFSDLCERSGLGKSKIETLIFGGAVDCFGEREYLFNWFNEVFSAKPKKKKKMQMDFFEDEDVEDTFEIKQKFSRQELEAMFFDLNGFSIMENLLLKYAKKLEQREDVKTIAEVKSGRTAKHVKMFCKIVGKDLFTSKSGSHFVKLTFSDGVDSADTVVQEGNWKMFSKTLKPGNVLILPVQLSDNGGFYLEDLNKKNTEILERE